MGRTFFFHSLESNQRFGVHVVRERYRFGPYSPLRSVFGRLQKDRLSRFAPRT